jgi:multiple sugar transport system substrate-binding protein
MVTTRRDLLRYLGLAGIAAGAAACAGAPKDPTTSSGGGGGGAKTFSVYWNAGHAYKAYDAVIADFEKAHGVTVNLNKQQWPDLRTRLLADFASGNVPDVVEEPGGWVQEFAISGDARPLQEYVDKDGSSIGFPKDWQPGTVERNSYQGKVYGIQLHYTCTLLLYNKAMLASAGVRPPTTWDDFLVAAKKLTKDGVHGVALNQDAGYSWPWLLQNGVRYYDPASKALLTPTDAAVEALQFQADLVHKHKVSPVPTPGTDYSGPQKLLSANRTAMILTGPWDLGPIAQTSPDLELGIAPPLRHKEQATISAGTSLFVPAKAKNPELSWDFIKRITALDVERAATKEVGMLMPRRTWADQPEVKNDERYKAFSQAFPFAVDSSAELRLTGKSGEISELYKTLYQSVVMRNEPAAKAVATFADAAGKVLGG